MEKYLELGKETARLAPRFVREMSEEVASLYLQAWDKSYQIGYPPRERLQPDFLESWLPHGHFAYLALNNSQVVGIALLAVEKLSSQMTVLEGCGAAIHPEFQKHGFGKQLSRLRVERRKQYSGKVIHVIGANYVSSGSQATSVRQDLESTSLQLALYNNSVISYAQEGLDPMLAVSNGEVIFEGSFQNRERQNMKELPFSLTDQRMRYVLQKLGFTSISLCDAKASAEFRCIQKEDLFNGRIDYLEDENGKVQDLEEIVQQDQRCKRIFVSSRNCAVQKELAKSSVLPVGISLAHENALVYQVLPNGSPFPDLCEVPFCKGGCRTGNVGKIHTPFESVKDVYHYLRLIHTRNV